MENILINKIELAAELAEKKLVDLHGEYMQIYVDDEAGIQIYTDEAQDIFNDYYDEYLTFVERLAI